jgi:dienelactone hydrolase
MKLTIPKSALVYGCLCSLLASGCAQELPPVPAATPPWDPVTATLEYGGPDWAPDGQDLYFSGGPPEQFRLYRTSRKGGEPVDVVKRLHCGNVSVNRVAGQIAFNAHRPGVALEIWTASLDGSSQYQLTKGGQHACPKWSPDGASLSYWSFPDRRVNIISVKGEVTKSFGPSHSPGVWSPNGREIGFVEGDQALGTYHLARMSLADESRRVVRSTIATNMPWNVFDQVSFDWSPEGREIVWPVLIDGRMQLVLIDVVADRILNRLPTQGFASSPKFSPDGHWIAYASESSSHVRGIRVISRDGSEDTAVTKPVEFVKAEFLRYPSTRGAQIPSFLIRPAGGTKMKRPAIVWLHGAAPNGSTLDLFDRGIQYFAGNGFVVLAPNFRPSYGFGAEIASVASGKDIAADVAAAAAYLKGLEEVDPDRVCVLGTSFGGYAALRTITTYPSVFAAAVDLTGACDLNALYAEMPMHRSVMTVMLGGSPDQQPERYREESPITHVDRITIPLLAIHGTADKTTPYNQSQSLVAALQKAGKPHKLITYRGVDHGFPAPVWANAMQQSMAFLRQNLDRRPGPEPP